MSDICEEDTRLESALNLTPERYKEQFLADYERISQLPIIQRVPLAYREMYIIDQAQLIMLKKIKQEHLEKQRLEREQKKAMKQSTFRTPKPPKGKKTI